MGARQAANRALPASAAVLSKSQIGLPVTVVRGFAVCGSKCSGIGSAWSAPKYATGFVKLAAPQTLDGQFEVTSNWQVFDASDPAGLELLIYFLKYGKSFEYQQLPVLWEARQDLPDRCPSLFTAPPVLWDNTNDRELVAVRTLDSAKGLLDMVVGKKRRGWQAMDAKESLEGALRSNVDELGKICFHGDIPPHNVAVDEKGRFSAIRLR